MDRKEVIKWLKIMKANLNSFPEVSNAKKIEALAEAIRLLKNEESIDKIDCNHMECRNCTNHKYCDYESSSSEKPNKSEIPTGSNTKNDLGVDCISRADAIKAMQNKAKKLKNEDTINGLCGAVAILYEMPSVTPQLSVSEVTALAEWTEKLTKECEEAYNKGYADGKKEQEPKNCEDCEIVQGCIEAGIRATQKALEQEPILDKIRAEIETKYGHCDICEYFEDYDYEENDISEYRPIGNIADILQIIDKYKAESERNE